MGETTELKKLTPKVQNAPPNVQSTVQIAVLALQVQLL